MSRIRTIKPEWLDDGRLLESGSDARTLSVSLVLMADDKGRGRIGKATYARVFPCEPPGTFEAAMAALTPWFVRLYEVRGQQYFEIVNWLKHQKIDRPSKAHTPEPGEGFYIECEVQCSPGDILAPQPDLDCRLAFTRAEAHKAKTVFEYKAVKSTYAIQGVEGGLVKVGAAIDPEARLKTFQTANPVRIRIIAVTSKLERDIHQELECSRVFGEWFSASNQLLEAFATPVPDTGSRESRESLAPDLDLDLDLDLDRDRDLTRERARAATPTNFSRTAATASFDTEGVVKREFISHFVEATGCEWLPGPHGQAVFDLAVSVAGQAKRDSRTAEEVLAQTLKHFFADEWVKQRVYPIRHLSGNFARYYNPPRRPESEAAYSTPEERDARMQKIFDGIAEENRKKGLLK